MRVEILADTIADNRVVLKGEILANLSAKDARYLILLGKAVELIDVEELEPEFVTEEVITDEVRVRRRARKP